MSGIIGHTMCAILGGKAAGHRKLPIVPLIYRHYASYLCGAYLGCDIQTMPEAVCLDTGKEVGYGTASLEKSPLTGGEVRPWTLEFDGREYRPREIHRTFYGRSHLVFGWDQAERVHTVPWDHLADYCAAVADDAVQQFGPSERQVAYLFGWMAHIVGDSLIKSVQPGIDLDLLDGKYTPRNRPIQDLVTFHEVGVKELGLHWPALLTDLAETRSNQSSCTICARRGLEVNWLSDSRTLGLRNWSLCFEPFWLRTVDIRQSGIRGCWSDINSRRSAANGSAATNSVRRAAGCDTR